MRFSKNKRSQSKAASRQLQIITRDGAAANTCLSQYRRSFSPTPELINQRIGKGLQTISYYLGQSQLGKYLSDPIKMLVARTKKSLKPYLTDLE